MSRDRVNKELMIVPVRELFRAARERDWGALRRVIEANPELVNETDTYGGTIWRHVLDNPEIVVWLLQRGADINSRDQEGQTPLHFAALLKDSKMAEFVLAHGADINARDHEGRTALHVAALFEDPNVARVLLARGAEVDAKDSEGNTPLYNAVFRADPQTAALLLEGGADVNALNHNSKTALHFALFLRSKEADSHRRRRFDDVIAILRRHGASEGGSVPRRGTIGCGIMALIVLAIGVVLIIL